MVDKPMMGFLDQFLKPRKKALPSRDRRVKQRFDTHSSLNCPLGELVDLSVSGMKVMCLKKPMTGGVLRFNIGNGSQRLPVAGRVVRVRRVGMKRFEAGVMFVDITPAKAKAIEALAKFGFIGGSSDPFSMNNTKKPRASVADLYGILGVRRDASDEQIRHAFHELARKHHPDISHNAESAKAFQACHDAYVTLKDRKSRQAYDAMTSGE